MKKLIAFMVVAFSLSFPNATRAQGWMTTMDKLYADESHCLTSPEIRSNKDNPISCFCRDAILDARYVWHTYLLPGKDRNLNGAYLALWTHAEELCGEHYDVLEAIEEKDWKWGGPEVTRTYPPDSEIKLITPDSNGFRLVRFKVRLTYHDSQGHTTKVENYTAVEKFPLNWDSHPSRRTPHTQ